MAVKSDLKDLKVIAESIKYYQDVIQNPEEHEDDEIFMLEEESQMSVHNVIVHDVVKFVGF